MIKNVILIVLVFLLLSGCSSGQNQPGFPAATSIAKPEDGTATISGTLISINNNNLPMENTLVRLAKIYGEGKQSIYVLNDSDSPGANTTSMGLFVFKNVEPGAYAILFADENGAYRSILETSEKIFTVEAKANDSIDMGVIPVDLTNPGP